MKSGVLVLTLLAVACAGGGADSAVVIDSAGVRITTLGKSPFQQGAAWTLAAEPRLSIGVDEGDPSSEFHRVGLARRLADGSIVVANGTPAELRVFDASGKFVRKIGGSGQGPGEFQNIDWFETIGPDTLLITDMAAQRASVFTPSGKLQRLIPLRVGFASWPADSRLSSGDHVYLMHASEDVWLRIRSGTARPGTTERNVALLMRQSKDGSAVDTLGWFSGLENAIGMREPGRFFTTYPPWGRHVGFAVANDQIYIGTQEKGEVAVYRPDGALSALLRWPSRKAPVTQADVGVYVDAAAVGMPDSARTEMAKYAASIALPPQKPEYGRLLVASDGLLWISEAHVLSVAPRLWSIVDPARGVIAQLTVPPRFELFEVGQDFVLGRHTDESGVQRVQVFDLRRDAPQ